MIDIGITAGTGAVGSYFLMGANDIQSAATMGIFVAAAGVVGKLVSGFLYKR